MPAPDSIGPMERASGEYDSQIAKLPHPTRIMAALERTAEAAGYHLHGEDFYSMLLGKATYNRLIELLRECPLNLLVIERMVRESTSFARFAAQSLDSVGATYQGNLFWLLDHLRWRTQGRHFFQTTDALEQMLAETDIGEGIPASFVRPPYDIQYIEAGETRSSALKMWHAESGEHALEGMYVLTGVVPEPLPEQGQRFIEFVFTGSPMGKANNTDDCTSSITLVIPDETATMLEVLEHSLTKNPVRTGIDIEHDKYVRPAIFHAAKILLYLNSEKAIRVPLKERTEMEARLKRLKGSGKAAKLQRQLPRAYDRIVIGPKVVPKPPSETRGAGHAKAPHWRRGHFRNQRHGPAFSQQRLIWIEPIIVHGDELGVDTSKNYVIKAPQDLRPPKV